MISVERVQEYINLENESEYRLQEDAATSPPYGEGKNNGYRDASSPSDFNNDDGEETEGLLNNTNSSRSLTKPLVKNTRGSTALLKMQIEQDLVRASLSPLWSVFVRSVTKLHDDWPSDGRIEFSSLSMRYDESTPYALNGITLNIASGSKVCF